MALDSGVVSGLRSFDCSLPRRHYVHCRRQHLGPLVCFQPAHESAKGPLRRRRNDISSLSLRWWRGAGLEIPRKSMSPTTTARRLVTTNATDDATFTSHRRSTSHPDRSDAPIGRLSLAIAPFFSREMDAKFHSALRSSPVHRIGPWEHPHVNDDIRATNPPELTAGSACLLASLGQ